MGVDTPKQKVDVEFKASGLSKLKTQWLDFAGDLLEPVAILAAGGSKGAAAWSGMRNVFLTKVLGPLGMVVGAATGFLLVTKKLISEWRVMGVQSAKAIETLTLQFKPLLGSMELAKTRAREIFNFGVKSPFRFAELAEGNKILQGLTRGALAGKDGMELVGDASAVAGNGFAETARSVGRLYDGLMSGRPVGEAAMRLQELGLISGQTRNQIDSMQAANAAGSAIWAVVQKDIQRTKGAMKDLEESLEGLESAHEDTQQALEAGFGQGFMEGEKAAIKSTTKVMESMIPTATYLGEQIGTVSNFFAKLKASLVDTVTSIPGFSTVMTAAAVAVTGFMGSIVLATGGLLVKFAMGLYSVAEANKQLARSAGSAMAAQIAQAGVNTALERAMESLRAAAAAVKVGNYVLASSHLKVAAAQTVAAVKTNGLAASQVILRGALGLTVKAVKFVTREIIAMSATILASPAFWMAAAFLAAGGAMLHFYNKAKKAREELEALAAAARAVISNLRQQALAIRSVADLRKAEADAVMKLTEAYKELAIANATAPEDGRDAKVAIAKKKLAAVREVISGIRAKDGKTDLTDEEVEREDAAKVAAKEAAKAGDDARAGRGESSALEVARERKAKGDKLKAAEEKMVAEEARIAAAQAGSRRKVEDSTAEQGALEGRRKVLISGINQSEGADAASVSGREREAMQVELAGLDEKLKKMAELKALEAQKTSDVALKGDSELAVLNEKLRIYNDLEAAKTDDVKASQAQEDAMGASRKDLTDEGAAANAADAIKERGAAAKRLAAAKAAAAGAGVSTWESRDRQNSERRVTEIKNQRAENLDPEAERARNEALADAEVGLAQARIDAESQVASLRLKGYERERAMLDFERQKLQVAMDKGRIDAESYGRQKELLDAQEAAAQKAGAEKGRELKDALEISNLNRREAEARRNGDTGKADALRAAADARADAVARRDATKEAEGMGGSAAGRQGYVDAQVAEAQAARAAERKRVEQEQALGRERSSANQNSAAAGIQARALQMQGQGKAAKRVAEDAARVQDEVDRKEKQRAYREQGFGGAQADAMANKDVKTQQAERLMAGMGDMKGGVIASSLAAVGGGGNVGGSDLSVKLQERMVELLRDIADNSKSEVDDGMW